jgi:hypothetical protein
VKLSANVIVMTIDQNVTVITIVTMVVTDTMTQTTDEIVIEIKSAVDGIMMTEDVN